jgi:cell wall-associated NlpC family hydrolase
MLLSNATIVTDDERSSIVRAGRRTSSLRRWTGFLSAVVTAVATVALSGAGQAAADPLAAAKAQAAAVNARLQSEANQLDIASQQLDAAQQQVQSLHQQGARLHTQISATLQQVGVEQSRLRDQALQAYMSGSTGTGSLSALFSSNGEQASASQEYRSVADGSLAGAIDQLRRAETLLSSEQRALQTNESQAQAALDAANAARQAAQAAVASQRQILAGLNGHIATLVAQQQAQQQAAQVAAFRNRVAAAANAAGSGVSPGATSPNLPSAGGAATAVAAAESQLGVPYVWGGETPGVGFDCSGLTQWAWGRAGVSLPRTAQAQYDAIPHIPLSALQPGDLVFWDDGTGSVQHVGMYVGNGDVVHAPTTGETVSYAPIWGYGLVGAGRP